MGTVALKLNGKPFSFSNPSPAAERVRQFLSSAPIDELYSSDQLCAQCKVGICTLTRLVPELAANQARFGQKRVWGSAKAISAFNKGMKEAGR